MDQTLKNNFPVDYSSEFEYAASQNSNGGNDSSYEKDAALSPREEIYKKPKTLHCSLSTQMKKEQYEKDYLKHQSFSLRAHLLTMDTYSRHKKLVNDYVALYCDKTESKSENTKDTTTTETVKEHQRFLWHEGDDLDSWGSRLAKMYWERLFKEYCLIDLTRFKQNKFGMRWRLEKEVIVGKGQFICGDYCCEEKDDLRSWEVKFNYVEKGEKRSALVKVRLCPGCSEKLNHHHQRREVTKFPRKRRLLSSAPLDDDIVDKDALSGSNIEEIKVALKRARTESNKSLTKEDEDNYSSGPESSTHSSDNVFIMQSGYVSGGHGDSSHNSVTSSGPSSPMSASSQSEDESVPPVKGIKKKAYTKEEDFHQYIDDLLL